MKSRVRLSGNTILRLRLHQNLDPVDCRLRVSLKRYAAFYSCGRWAPAIPTWVTTQSHDMLSMFVDFGLSVTNTQSQDHLSMFADFELSVPTSGIPRLLTTPGLNLMSYHSAHWLSVPTSGIPKLVRKSKGCSSHTGSCSNNVLAPERRSIHIWMSTTLAFHSEIIRS